MKINTIAKQVTKSQVFTEVSCSIDAVDMKYIAGLLRNNYSDTPWATVREVVANASDACREAGNGSCPTVFVPNRLSLEFVVRDYGNGLSREDVFGLYSKYGKSTKRDENNSIGGFGIGRFAPLSYTDVFTVESYVNGRCNVYAVRVDEWDDTKITEMTSYDTAEPNGIAIKVPVRTEDCVKFAHNINRLAFFGVPMTVKGHEVPKWNCPTVAEEKGMWEIRSVREVLRSLGYDYNQWGYSGVRHFVVMGGVPYPLEINQLEDKNNRFIQGFRGDSLILRLPIGSVKLHHSREMIEYNEPTKKILNAAADHLRTTFGKKIQADVEACKDYIDAFDTLNLACKSINYDLLPQITWRGKALEGHWQIRLAKNENKNGKPSTVYRAQVQSFTSSSSNVTGMTVSSGRGSSGPFSKKVAIILDDYSSLKVQKNIYKKAFHLLNNKFDEVRLFSVTEGSFAEFTKHFNEVFKNVQDCGVIFKLSQCKMMDLPKRAKGPSRAKNLIGVKKLSDNGSCNINYAWESFAVGDSLPSGKKYFLPLVSGYVDVNGTSKHPAQLNWVSIKKFLDLPQTTKLFGLTPKAQERFKGDAEWINIIPLVKKEREAQIAKMPMIASSGDMNFKTLFYKNSWIMRLQANPMLCPQISDKILDFHKKADALQTDCTKINEIRNSVRAASNFFFGEIETSQPKDQLSGDIAKFLEFCREYMPFLAMTLRSWRVKHQSELEKISHGINEMEEMHIKSAVTIMNAIFKAKNS